MERKSPHTPVDPAKVAEALENLVEERSRPGSTVQEEPRPSTSASTGSRSLSQRISETLSSVRSTIFGSEKGKEMKKAKPPKGRRIVGELYVRAGPGTIESSESSSSGGYFCKKVSSESSSLPSSIPSEPLPPFSDESSDENSAAKANITPSAIVSDHPSGDVTIPIGSDDMKTPCEVPDINPSRATIEARRTRIKDTAPEAGQASGQAAGQAAGKTADQAADQVAVLVVANPQDDDSQLTTTTSVPPRVVKVQCPTPQPPVAHHWSDWVHTVAQYWSYLFAAITAPVTFGIFILDSEYLFAEAAYGVCVLGLTIAGCSPILLSSLLTSIAWMMMTGSLICLLAKLYILTFCFRRRNYYCITLVLLLIGGLIVTLMTRFICSAQNLVPHYRKYWHDLEHHEIIPPKEPKQKRLKAGEAGEAAQPAQAEQAEDPNLIRPGSEDTQASSRDASSIPVSRATNRGDSRLEVYEEIALQAEKQVIPEEADEPEQIDTAV